ncbi:mitochondrial amidoxime-reducing component 1-like [Pollicipes pollicipes]|uniref:mitochondrial amidoxime-reducing component 1-like n=1 Tax=Pollicipes pollicipes TaxID=41117 RepID=UPI001884A92A|nr:mitochondrial amidoxime-reducing component 1-like [Pollicipes pollicipes]
MAESRLLPLLAAAALLGAALLLTWRRRRRPGAAATWTPAGRLAAIHLYPLKSGAGQRCQRVRVTRLGVRRGAVLDRCLAVVYQGRVVSASARRRLVLVAADVDANGVTLTAPGMPPLTVPFPQDGDDVSMVSGTLFGYPSSGVDLGPVVSRWLAEFFGDAGVYTLMYFLPGVVTPRRTVDIPKPYASLASPDDISAFTNVTPISVICTSSLDALNSRMETPVFLENFRHNLIIEGAPAFDDDNWSFVKIGDAVLRRIKPVQRCPTTCVNPQTGERSERMEPLKTLRTFRLAKTEDEKKLYKEAPLFGTGLGVDVEGDVAVGDAIYVLRK